MDDAKKYSFKDLGIPEELIHEVQDSRLKLRAPPQELVERTIKECVMLGKRKLYCTQGYVAEVQRKADRYVARFPDFDYFETTGKTLEEAKQNAARVGRVYLCGLVNEGKEFPKPTYRAENLLLNTPMDYLTGRRNYRITFELN